MHLSPVSKFIRNERRESYLRKCTLKDYGSRNQLFVWCDKRQTLSPSPTPMILVLDDFRFWVQEELGTFGPYGLMIPARNATNSWDAAEPEMRNKLICESVALLKTDDE